MTQEYTPVAWQDETTSQQGTLINAERLNQMQQAHHYADGLEEVDAIPTADPGVSYHKIVYCTADSTIYRWDGTAWTADIDDETKQLLQEEIARATEAEGELAQDITDEATARETADTAMQADITALESGKLDKQTAGASNVTKAYGVRGNVQRMLSVGYGSEYVAQYNIEQTLFSKMPTLYDPIDDVVVNYGWATAQIGAEATARADADTALGGRIDTEQARAEAAEQANAQAIANTYTKAEIDTALGAKADVATTYTKAETDALLGAKVDKLTTSGVKAYTHNGSTQGDTEIVDGTAAATIPIRDANGRMQAADPASGATDKTLVTANWVSQTGDEGPNNLIHKSGNETKNGVLTVKQSVANLYGKWIRIIYSTPPADWIEVLRLQAANTQRYFIEVNGAVNASSSMGYGLLMILHDVNLNPLTNWIIHKQRGVSMIDTSRFAVVKNSDNTTSLYYKDTAWSGIDVMVKTDLIQSSIGQLSDVKIRSEITPNDVMDITTLNYTIPVVL